MCVCTCVCVCVHVGVCVRAQTTPALDGISVALPYEEKMHLAPAYRFDPATHLQFGAFLFLSLSHSTFFQGLVEKPVNVSTLQSEAKAAQQRLVGFLDSPSSPVHIPGAAAMAALAGAAPGGSLPVGAESGGDPLATPPDSSGRVQIEGEPMVPYRYLAVEAENPRRMLLRKLLPVGSSRALVANRSPSTQRRRHNRIVAVDFLTAGRDPLRYTRRLWPNLRFSSVSGGVVAAVPLVAGGVNGGTRRGDKGGGGGVKEEEEEGAGGSASGGRSSNESDVQFWAICSDRPSLGCACNGTRARPILDPFVCDSGQLDGLAVGPEELPTNETANATESSEGGTEAKQQQQQGRQPTNTICGWQVGKPLAVWTREGECLTAGGWCCVERHNPSLKASRSDARRVCVYATVCVTLSLSH
eukprot:GHVU01184099.1.p1 GENE.GHVU01184099.1~~GHVU01184099.1.p1  ORF type:complete len:414 (-),score=79.20 GHVU01184099.1:375-1616(-)